MRVGIIGHRGAGRSTLFEALTGQTQSAPQDRTRLGVTRVHDPRVDKLTALCQPKKTVYAELTLALPPGAMDISALREMREIRAYAHVISAFTGEALEVVIPAQVSELKQELVLADMERVEKRLANIQKAGNPRAGEKEALDRAAPLLEKEQLLRAESWNEVESGLFDELGLVSHRPMLAVVNVDEAALAEALPAAAQQAVADYGTVLVLSAQLEREIADLDAEAQSELLAAYNLEAPVSQRFAHACLGLLDQICFFTVGPDEVRAWPIPKGVNARRAARAIHSDLEKGFIRAEVISYDAFVEHGSEAKCRAVGQLRVEGKDYLMVDGDIVNVRFNV